MFDFHLWRSILHRNSINHRCKFQLKQPRLQKRTKQNFKAINFFFVTIYFQCCHGRSERERERIASRFVIHWLTSTVDWISVKRKQTFEKKNFFCFLLLFFFFKAANKKCDARMEKYSRISVFVEIGPDFIVIERTRTQFSRIFDTHTHRQKKSVWILAYFR